MNLNVTVANSSPFEYWVNFDWQGPDIPVGILVPGKAATAIGIPWPNVPDAKLVLVEQKTNERHVVGLSLSNVNEQIDVGKCKHITIRILSDTNANITCE
jgi:hypothetical protein